MRDDEPDSGQTVKREWVVTAVYADVIDTPQVYDTTVEAETEEEAEQEARRAAVEDNGGTWPDDKGSYELADLYVRLAPDANRDSIALDSIAALLSGAEWDADTAPAVVEIVRATGRTIADYASPDDDEPSDDQIYNRPGMEGGIPYSPEPRQEG